MAQDSSLFGQRSVEVNLFHSGSDIYAFLPLVLHIFIVNKNFQPFLNGLP